MEETGMGFPPFPFDVLLDMSIPNLRQFLAIAIGSFAAGFNCGVESLGMLNVYLTSLALLAFEGVR